MRTINVAPAKAGTHAEHALPFSVLGMDPRLRGDDEFKSLTSRAVNFWMQ
jgi:hypothetical protein